MQWVELHRKGLLGGSNEAIRAIRSRIVEMIQSDPSYGRLVPCWYAALEKEVKVAQREQRRAPTTCFPWRLARAPTVNSPDDRSPKLMRKIQNASG